MKLKYKVLSLVMFVMLICCVSAASAADVDNITVPDDADVIEIDEAVDSVDAVEIDGISEGGYNEQNLRSTDTGKVNGDDYSNYFDTTTGALTNTAANTLTFTGNFNEKAFSNFVINRAVTNAKTPLVSNICLR